LKNRSLIAFAMALAFLSFTVLTIALSPGVIDNAVKRYTEERIHPKAVKLSIQHAAYSMAKFTLSGFAKISSISHRSTGFFPVESKGRLMSDQWYVNGPALVFLAVYRIMVFLYGLILALPGLLAVIVTASWDRRINALLYKSVSPLTYHYALKSMNVLLAIFIVLIFFPYYIPCAFYLAMPAILLGASYLMIKNMGQY